MKSGFHFLNKGRNVATEISSTSQAGEWILKNTKRVIGFDDDDSGARNVCAKTHVSFGSVNECIENSIQHFEEDIVEVHGSTPCHLETVDPVDDLDKSWRQQKKLHPSAIRTLFAKVFPMKIIRFINFCCILLVTSQ